MANIIQGARIYGPNNCVNTLSTFDIASFYGTGFWIVIMCYLPCDVSRIASLYGTAV